MNLQQISIFFCGLYFRPGPDGGCPLGPAAHGEVHAILARPLRGVQRCGVLQGGATLKFGILGDTELEFLGSWFRSSWKLEGVGSLRILCVCAMVDHMVGED